jgi:ABC-type nitrate/sulfonate/bicarbonate transport system substrate-binding protein
LVQVGKLCITLDQFHCGGQALVKVPVQIPSISPAVSAFALARNRGYYRQEGLDVQLVLIPSALGMQALLAGNIKFSTAGGSGLLPILRGAR